MFLGGRFRKNLRSASGVRSCSDGWHPHRCNFGRAADGGAAHLRTIDRHVPRGACFGRKREIERIISALLDGQTPIAIGGGPGIGKTTIAVEALYDPRITAKFQTRRVFVSLERATEPYKILVELAGALGLDSKGSESDLLAEIGKLCAANPVAAILDNCETPHTADAAETERILRLLGHIGGLALIVTARESRPPSNRRCRSTIWGR